MNTNTHTQIDHASVKVMRSHDYCHFEVVLGTLSPATPEEIDELRKTAARLADKAVQQYKIAKANALRLQQESSEREFLRNRIERIRNTPEGERTVDEQAKLKAWDDAKWEASRRFDYEDDWADDQEDSH